MTRRVASGVAAMLVMLALPAVASAHPLGNFTINHYSRISLHGDGVDVLYVLDMAEIPAFSAQQEIDTDDDGTSGPAETKAWLDELVPRLVEQLSLELGGHHVALETVARELSFPAGQAGLSTLRLELTLNGPFVPPTGSAAIDGSFADATYEERIGWHEVIVVADDGAALIESSVPARDVSDELRSYPPQGRDDPIDVREATFTFRLVVGGAPAVAEQTTTSAPSASADPLASLLAGGMTSPASWVFAIFISLGLGAGHAISPGHGKTLVAAYLVGARGSRRQALWLATTVALTHTAGVFVLGGIVLGASELLVPERVVEWLAVASGLIVIVLGASLAIRSVRRSASATHIHGHGPDQGHGHGHGESHRHPHPPAAVLSTRSVALVGLAGGLVPSASALIVLLIAVTQHQLALGVVLIVAFGVGMAMVLGVVGIGVVLARDRLSATGELANRPGLARIGRAMPIASAFAVLVIGLVLTVQAIGRVS